MTGNPPAGGNPPPAEPPPAQRPNQQRQQQPRGQRRNQNNNRNNGRGGFQGTVPAIGVLDYYANSEGRHEEFDATVEKLKQHVTPTIPSFVQDILAGFDDLVAPVAAEPVIPDPNAPNLALLQALFPGQAKQYLLKQQAISDFQKKLATIVWGQCTDTLRQKIEADARYAGAAENDGYAMLQIIRDLYYDVDLTRNPLEGHHALKAKFYAFKKRANENINNCHHRFKKLVTALIQANITIADKAMAIHIAATSNPARGPDALVDEDWAEAERRAIAFRFLKACEKDPQARSYLASLRNTGYRPANNVDDYPVTLDAMLTAITGHDMGSAPVALQSDGMAFGQQGTENVICFNCQQAGHYAAGCPNPRVERPRQGQDGAANITMGHVSGFSFALNGNTFQIPDSWLVLDSASTINLIKTPELLKNIRLTDTEMRVHGNGGLAYRPTRLIGDLPGYDECWYDPQSLTNLLSLSKALDMFQVTLVRDEKGDAFLVTKPNGRTWRFNRHACGLFYLDTADPDLEWEGEDEVVHDADEILEAEEAWAPLEEVDEAVLVTTVEDKKSNYTSEDYSKAVVARRLQKTLNFPSLKDFARYITKNQLPNCPVTRADIMRAEDIFGPAVEALKGKTVRRRPDKVREVISPLPSYIIKLYKDVTFAADIMFVNGIAMLLTISRKIKFGTVEELVSQNSKTLLGSIKKMCQIYARGGFRPRIALMDRQFEPLRGELAEIGIALNTTGTDEHVGDIERFVRTIKERMRCIKNMLPFDEIPPRLIIEMAKASVFWRNAFPVVNGVSKDLSPRTIVTGQTIDFKRHCKYTFGEYVQTHEEHDNGMEERTAGAIATRPTGNAQGTWWFYCISTMRMVARNRATKLPMPLER
jgi:hypothetical protein